MSMSNIKKLCLLVYYTLTFFTIDCMNFLIHCLVPVDIPVMMWQSVIARPIRSSIYLFTVDEGNGIIPGLQIESVVLVEYPEKTINFHHIMLYRVHLATDES
jgi:hypothetical protein